MNFNKILDTKTREIAPNLIIVWNWYDRSDETPYFVHGTSENMPQCGTYLNGKLVATVYFHFDIPAETVINFLERAKPYTKMPGWSPMPLELPNG